MKTKITFKDEPCMTAWLKENKVALATALICRMSIDETRRVEDAVKAAHTLPADSDAAGEVAP
jgi:hypothetical protein